MLVVFTKTTISVKLLVVELILTCTVHPHDQHWGTKCDPGFQVQRSKSKLKCIKIMTFCKLLVNFNDTPTKSAMRHKM